MEYTLIDCRNRPRAPFTYSGLADTTINVHTLIEEVRKRSEIWDRRLPSHSNQSFVKQAWKSISEAMGIPAPLIRKRWKNLRDQFGVEIARSHPSKWAHFDSLIFLNGFVKPREKQDAKQDLPAESLPMNPEEESDPLAFSPNEEIKEETNDSSSNEEKFDPSKVKVVTIVTTAITPVQSVQPLVTAEKRFVSVATGTQPAATIVTSQAFNPTNFAVTPTVVNVGSVSLPGQSGAFNPFQFVAVGPGMLPQTINTQAFDPTKFGVVNVGPVSHAQSMSKQTFNANNFGVVNVGTASLPQMISTQAFDPTKFVAVASTSSLPDQSMTTQTNNSAKFGVVNVRPVSLPAQAMTTEAFDATKFEVNVRPVSLPQSASLPTTNTFSSIKVLNVMSQKPSVQPFLPTGTEKKPGAVDAVTPTPRVQPVTAEIVDSEYTNIRTYGTNPEPGQKKKRPRLNIDDLVPKLKSPNEGNKHTTAECEDLTTEDGSTEDENDENFFRSLLPHVRKIPMHLKLRFRNRVHELVEEFAYPEVRKSKH